MTANDLAHGRNGNHQYNLHFRPPTPEPKYKRDGTLAKVQPAMPKPKFKVPGVTTIVGLLDKPGLTWGAAKETAKIAVDEPHRWQHLERDMAFEIVRTHFRKVWDLKAETGNIVHEVALAWAKEQEADLDYLLTYDEKGEERTWTGEERNEVLRRVNGCVDALELFYLEKKPKWRYVEQSVAHPYCGYSPEKPWKIDAKTSYGGCFDADGELSGEGEILLDWKTGRRYPIETILQVAGGYGNAPLLAYYDDEGWLVKVEPYEAPKKRATVWLHDDGTYELLVLPSGRSVYTRFIQLRRQHAWLAEMRAWETAHPDPYSEIDADSGEMESETVASATESDLAA